MNPCCNVKKVRFILLVVYMNCNIEILLPENYTKICWGPWHDVKHEKQTRKETFSWLVILYRVGKSNNTVITTIQSLQQYSHYKISCLHVVFNPNGLWMLRKISAVNIRVFAAWNIRAGHTSLEIKPLQDTDALRVVSLSRLNFRMTQPIFAKETLTTELYQYNKV
jgi:hypothetical protein